MNFLLQVTSQLHQIRNPQLLSHSRLKLSGRSNLIFNFIYSQETSTRGLVSFILFISNSQPFCRSSSPCWLYPHLSLCTSDLKASGKETFTTKHLTRGWNLAHVAADSGRVFSTLHNTRTLQLSPDLSSKIRFSRREVPHVGTPIVQFNADYV